MSVLILTCWALVPIVGSLWVSIRSLRVIARSLKVVGRSVRRIVCSLRNRLGYCIKVLSIGDHIWSLRIIVWLLRGYNWAIGVCILVAGN